MQTKLNPVQLHLLQLFSHDLGPHELDDIRSLLANYFVERADEEMQRLQQDNPTTQTELDTLLTTHLRTVYQSK